MGRNRDLELPLPDLKLSRRHCQIYSVEEKFMVRDLGSTNGTFLNGERITGDVELNEFDRVVLGDTEIEFHLAAKMPLPANFDPNAADPVFDDLKIEETAGGDARPTTAGSVQSAHFSGGASGSGTAPALDPLETALRELALPLPAEPPPLQLAEDAATRAKVMFCDVCSGSIPMLDWDLGLAREMDGKMFCKECLEKPRSSLPAASPAPPSSPAPPPRKEKEKAKSISAILAGLNEEAVVVDTTLKRRGSGGHATSGTP